VCNATPQFAPIRAKLIDHIGVETMGLGLPAHPRHLAGTSKSIEEQFAGLSPEVLHKTTHENVGKF
jgi:hypothetical protein